MADTLTSRLKEAVRGYPDEAPQVLKEGGWTPKDEKEKHWNKDEMTDLPTAAAWKIHKSSKEPKPKKEIAVPE